MNITIRALKRSASVVLLLALGSMLASCATGLAGYPSPDRSRAYRDPEAVGTQTGRLTVIALDARDGGPLYKAIVDLVASANSRDSYHYRTTATTNQYGIAEFREVPKAVDVLIRHRRGEYGADSYPVPQSGLSEFRVYIDTTSQRLPNEDR
jgi:hypothetical protein